ncbi:MAG: PspA/IM30 family protein [Nannocystaceae bacterium]
MSSKPGIFSRLKNSITSTLNDAVEAVSDPGQEVALMLDDLAAQIKQSEADLRQAMVDAKVMTRKLEELRKDEQAWYGRAEQAMKLADEELARKALKRRAELLAECQTHEAALAEQERLVESMRKGILESKAKLKGLNLRRGSLMAQARAAKKGQSLGADGFGDAGAGSRLDEIESKIATLEAMNEVDSAEMNSKVAEAEIDAKLAQLSGAGSEVDDALEELKAKMRGGKALPSGDS